MSGWWTCLFCNSGEGEKPGGLALTQRSADFCGFDRTSRLLDVAAGGGETVRFLRERLGCPVIGLDSDPARQCPDVALGRGEELPFPGGSFDGLFLECALSQMERPEAVLSECARVLDGGGFLVLSDLYARKGGSASSPLGRLDSRVELEDRLRRAGLEPVLFEDHTPELISLWASAAMSGKGPVLRGPEGVKPGYCLCVARKGEVGMPCGPCI